MFNKLAVLIFTVIGYICMRRNNKQSEYKIKISSKIIKVIFPLLDKKSNGKIDIVLFLETAYLIIACIIYYIVIIIRLATVEAATTIWVAMFMGTTLIMVGWEFIRRSSNYNIVLILLSWILGLCLILCGIIITIFYLAEIISGFF
jgi:hypothetical protein